MKKFLLCLSFILLIAAPAAKAAAFYSPVTAQVIISTGQDSARSAVTDSTAATPTGNDYSRYARDEKSGRMWRWMIAIDLVILLLILFAIVRSRRKKK